MNTMLSLYTWLLISHIYRVHRERPVSFTLRQLAFVCTTFMLTQSDRYTNSARRISKALTGQSGGAENTKDRREC